jgi:hypothetical protein
LQLGFVRRTKRGREITSDACRHLGLKYQKKGSSNQPELFESAEQ